jgi:hypothetical protein
MKPPKPRSPCRRTPVAVLVAGLLEGVAWAQGADVDAMKLRRTPLLEEKIPGMVRRDMPTFLSGDSLNGQIDERVVIEGQAELRNRSTVLRGDWLQYTCLTTPRGPAETCASIAKATCTRRPRPNWRSKLSAGI